LDQFVRPSRNVHFSHYNPSFQIIIKKRKINYIKWLKGRSSATINKYHVELTSPTDFKDIYTAAINTIKDVKKKLDINTIQTTYHLSPGTPSMASCLDNFSKDIIIPLNL